LSEVNAFTIDQACALTAFCRVDAACLIPDNGSLYLSLKPKFTRNSSGDEIANVNFLYDDIVHVIQNTVDSCINSTTA